MSVGNIARTFVVVGAFVAAAGSASSTQNTQPSQPSQYGQNEPPPPQNMEMGRAFGVWRSNFGAVKIEADQSRGGAQAGAVQGVWMYSRQGQQVIGYFSGNMRGNILQFRWNEPPATMNDPPLNGEGFLVFDPQGRQYSGRWWSDRHDRQGDWNGWRQQMPANYGAQQPPPPEYGPAQQPPPPTGQPPADFGPPQQPPSAPPAQQPPPNYSQPPPSSPPYY